MKCRIDSKSIERPGTLDLICIDLAAEDGREFYAERSEVDWSTASRWTLQTVHPQLEGPSMPQE